MRAMRGPNPPRSLPGNFLALCQHPGPSIEKGATQMARNLTSPGIELGRALYVLRTRAIARAASDQKDLQK